VILDPTNYFKKKSQNNTKKGKPIILEINENGNLENYQEFGVFGPPVEEYRPQFDYQNNSKGEYRVFQKVNGLCINIIQKNAKTSIEKEFELPPIITDIKYQNVNIKLIKDDAKCIVNDLFIYKSNGKYGAVLTDKHYLSPKYDFIRLLEFDEGSINPEYYFQVGIKDNISNKMKFGIVSLTGKVIKPIVYDVFRNQEDNKSDENQTKFKITLPQNAEFIVAKEGKYGIISMDEAKTKPIYDDIFYLDTKNYVLVKSNLYGIYFQDNHTINKKIIEPVFTKIPFKINLNGEIPIIELFDAYDSTKEYSDFYRPDILKRTGNFFCYGNINGMMYYKEK
jgi:hypothetical protein